jgi:hypothetical protein
VREAGGKFTSVSGEPGPHHGSGLSTNGLLHQSVVDILNDELHNDELRDYELFEDEPQSKNPLNENVDKW